MSNFGTAQLLQFLMPGFLHGMGNALFSIQSQAQVMSLGTGGNLGEITAGCSRANAVLEVLRLMSDREGNDDSAHAGETLRILTEPLQIALRERSLGFQCDAVHQTIASSVPKRTFVRVIVRTVAELCHALPTGSRGTVRLGWLDPEHLAVDFLEEPAQLPFEIPLEATCEKLVERLQRRGVDLARAAQGVGVVLVFPRPAET